LPLSSRPKTLCSPVRLLLDECLPARLKRDLTGHEARTVPEMGWAGKRNGELLALASSQFDVFLTVDRNLSFQQNLEKLKIAVIVMVARGNKHSDLQPVIADVQAVLSAIAPGQVVRVGA
jgi:predicted nuclease of predicted toxin-antitoxin system